MQPSLRRRQDAPGAGAPASGLADFAARPRIPWRGLLKRLLGVRLGNLNQYAPRPMRLPAHYFQPPSAVGPCPTISIVTPSLNQGDFIEATLRSVLNQGYHQLEYIVQDGGSTDGTAAILERYRDQLTHCAAAADGGQAEAINRGFRHARGAILAYLNSDDLLLPGALHAVADFFNRNPQVDVVYGNRIMIDAQGAEIGQWLLPPHEDAAFVWDDFIPQETLYWRRSIWEKVGGRLDEQLQFAMDWDLLMRFRAAGARFARLPRFLGAFRIHPEQKTLCRYETSGRPEVERIMIREHGHIIGPRERSRQCFCYLLKHAVCRRLHSWGWLRY